MLIELINYSLQDDWRSCVWETYCLTRCPIFWYDSSSIKIFSFLWLLLGSWVDNLTNLFPPIILEETTFYTAWPFRSRILKVEYWKFPPKFQNFPPSPNISIKYVSFALGRNGKLHDNLHREHESKKPTRQSTDAQPANSTSDHEFGTILYHTCSQNSFCCPHFDHMSKGFFNFHPAL